MTENAIEKITNVFFETKNLLYMQGIDFCIGKLEYSMLLKIKGSTVAPRQVIHYHGEGLCPFCNRMSVIAQPCFAFELSKESMHELFHYLTDHLNVRLKFLSLGLKRKGERG